MFFKRLDPKDALIPVLVILGIIGSVILGSYKAAVQMFSCLAFALVFEIAVSKIKKEPFFIPKSGMITALITSLIVAPNQPLYIALVIVFVALLSKHLIKINRNIFNPANFGLAIGGFFGVLESWWGASSMLLIAVLGSFLAWRVKRIWLALSFLVSHLTLYFVFFKDLYATLNAPMLFFALIMLIEPITSPKKTGLGVFIGIFTAFLGLALSFLYPAYNIVYALAMANLLTFAIERWQSRKIQISQAS